MRPISADEQKAMLAQMMGQQEQPAAEPEPAPPVVVEPAVQAGFVESDPTTWGNPARNDACPCGSGEKFKHCHGKLA